MSEERLPAVHPGEILRDEFLIPLNISQDRLAADISVQQRRINDIVNGSKPITADIALRLARYFGSSEMLWLNLQGRYELERKGPPGAASGSGGERPNNVTPKHAR